MDETNHESTPRATVAPLSQEAIGALDHGIRETVRMLRAMGYETTDSGDGKSKTDAIAEGCACDYPMVVIRESPEALVMSARRLHQELMDLGVEVDQVGRGNCVTIEASYDPANAVGIILVCGLHDAVLQTIHASPD